MKKKVINILFDLQSCKEKVDAVLFLFSFTDRTSFDDLANQIAKWNESSGSPVVTMVVGTKYPLQLTFMEHKHERDYFSTHPHPITHIAHIAQRKK